LVDVVRPIFLQNDENFPKTKTLVWSLAITFNILEIRIDGSLFNKVNDVKI
jgi:hypothetical protein